MTKRVILLGVVSVLLVSVSAGCSAAFWEGFNEGLAGAQGTTSAGNAYASSSKLMLFGGLGHETYLGCISCSEHTSDSVFNEYSEFGNEYSSSSIYNRYSQFGSRYDNYSACNPYASDPPVVVGEDGTYYGRLTVNTYNSDRFGDSNLQAWLDLMCQ